MNGATVVATGIVALAFAGCTSSDVKTSVYVEVSNGVGAPLPTEAQVEVFEPAVLGVPGALINKKIAAVSPTATGVLGSLVILAGTHMGGLHIRGTGLLNGVTVSQAETDVVITANKQVSATLTLAAIVAHPDAGPDADADMGMDADAAPMDMAAMDADAAGPDVQPDMIATDLPTDRPTGDAANGVHCSAHAQCQSGYCVDGVCCDSACAGACQACGPTGACAPAAAGTNPRSMCTDKGVDSCKTDGFCDGLGACRMYTAGRSCAGTPACVAGNGAVASAYACDGAGTCAPSTQMDCKGFACTNAVCGTTCTNDTGCVTGAFCSAGACVRKPSNLAGNGDVEYGSTIGWATFAGGAPGLSTTTAAGFAHAGTYSTVGQGRTIFYQGPAYTLPSGPGKYTMSVWGMQNQDPTLSGTVSIAMYCNSGQNFLVLGTFGAAMAMGNWINFSGTVDTSVIPDCVATATPPGVTKGVVLYLNQVQSPAATPIAYPDLYLDDLVVQVTDGHNLVGNPNFEAGAIDGWGVNGIGTLAVSTTVAKGGTHSLVISGRSATTVGHKYTLPLGAAHYTVTFNVLHNGTTPHSLSLIPSYSCLGGAAVVGTPVAMAPNLAANTWAMLSGDVTVPPPAAAAGCRLADASVSLQQETGACGSAAGQIECPDLFVDDVSITVAP